MVVLCAGASGAVAADIEAGKAKAAIVCAACHGALGASVSDTIPNLAGQKARYIEIQLKALREGTRKNPIMGATPNGARRSRRCCATRTGTTQRSPPTGSPGPASTRPQRRRDR
jgi:hypothetical protein